jgi:Tol biopolymer transport system component
MDVFVHGLSSGETSRVSVSSSGDQSNGLSDEEAISNRGGVVAFVSNASNLVPGPDTNWWDVFVHKRLPGTTRQVDVSTSGARANCWSFAPDVPGDGRFIAFESCASNLVRGGRHPGYQIFVRDPYR